MLRIIARLDIKGPNLVKGIHLEGLRVLGNPQDFSEYYYNNGIDELIYMDTVASLYERNSLLEMISKSAKNFFQQIVGGVKNILLVEQTGIKPAISSVTGRNVDRYTTGPAVLILHT